MSIYDKASLVLIPSGTKTSKVYSQKPVNGDGDFTFSRSTAATRVNADGNIEKETQNLLLQSNTFDTTWATTFASVTSGQSGYDGSSNAWKLQNTSGGVGRVVQSLSTSGVQTFSIYAKGGNVDWMALYLATSPTPYVYYDITNGVLGTSVGDNDIDAKIEDAGNGYYRCQITYNGSPSEVRVFIGASDGTLSTNSGDNIYIQDAQLEQGLVARDYIPTTTSAVEGGITDNVPRLDYTDASCPSLLLEPQRTNSIPHSEYFGSGWSLLSGGSLSFNQTTSPEGLQNASLLSGDGVNANAAYFGTSVTSGSSYSFSLFAKANGQNLLRMRGFSTSAGGNVIFDLSDGTIDTAPDDNLSNAKIEAIGDDGWYRCSVVATADATDSNALFGFDYSGSSASGGLFYIYGAQFEAGSYATSYIPTYGSAVTRNNDYMRLLATNFYSTTSYTYFLDIDLPNDVNTSSALWKDNDNLPANGGFQLRKTSAGGTYVGITTHTGSGWVGFATDVLTGRLKIVLRYNNGVVEMWYNGNKSAQTFNVTGWNQSTNNFKFQDGSYGTYETEQFLFIPTALTDQEAIDLTTI